MRFKITYFIVLISVIACKTPEARKPETVKTGTFIQQSIERNKVLYAQEKKKIEIYITNSEKEYTTSNNGFWYTYLNKIDTPTLPTAEFGNEIVFNYNIKNLNNIEIYSKEELKTIHYIMDKQELFTGLREGLKLMKTGEIMSFIFPSQKAYGYYGDENKIGSNIPLVCEVSVHLIKK